MGVLVALGAIMPLRPPEADVAVTLGGDDELLPEGAGDDGADAAVGPPALAPLRKVRVVAVDDVLVVAEELDVLPLGDRVKREHGRAELGLVVGRPRHGAVPFEQELAVHVSDETDAGRAASHAAPVAVDLENHRFLYSTSEPVASTTRGSARTGVRGSNNASNDKPS